LKKSEFELNIVGIILARGGSKRLPGKNIRPLGGRPLIAHTVAAAKGATSLVRAIVSTDDEEIAQIAASFGAEVPFRRPAEMATDISPPIDAVAHAVDWLDRNGSKVDAIVLLQASSPLRNAAHIDEAVALFRASDVDTVTSVSPASSHPYWCWKPDGAEIKPFFSSQHIAMARHQLPPALIENGAVYVFRRDLLAAGTIYGDRIAGYLMSETDAVDIDTADDFDYAEFVLARRSPV
jgi:CMP-N,N'-diacetyllegionaminic acid synthase